MQLEILDPAILTYAVHGFLLPEECRSFIAGAETAGFGPAPISTPGGPVMAPEVRNHLRVMIDDCRLARKLWERARRLVPEDALDWRDGARRALGFNERFRFFRYDRGQRFRRHRDSAYIRDQGEASSFSFIIYLNEEFEGGETRFFTDRYRPRFSVRPRTGTALIFRHNQYHEGCTVRSGRKYVMRTDVMYRYSPSKGPENRR